MLIAEYADGLYAGENDWRGWELLASKESSSKQIKVSNKSFIYSYVELSKWISVHLEKTTK